MKKLKRIFVNQYATKCLYAKRIFGLALAGTALSVFVGGAQAQTIVSDNFTSGSQYGVSTVGLVPDTTNVPGGVYQLVGSGDGDSSEHKHTQNNVQLIIGGISTLDAEHNSGAVAIPIATTGGYTQPSTLQISATFNPNGNNESGATLANRGAYLGFYSQAGATTTGSSYNSGFAAGDSPTSHLVGFELLANGALNLVVNGVTTATSINAGASAFNATTGYTTLSFQMTSGSGYYAGSDVISNISIGGVSYSGSYSLALGSHATDFAGFGAAGGSEVGFTHFEVDGGAMTAVPEPSTYALLLAGGVALGFQQFRRRRNDV